MPLRVGVSVPSIELEAWQADVLEALAAAAGVDLVGLVVLDAHGWRPGRRSPPLGRWSKPRARQLRTSWSPRVPIVTVGCRVTERDTLEPDAAGLEALTRLAPEVIVHLGPGWPGQGMRGVAVSGVMGFRFGGSATASVDEAVSRSLVTEDPTVRADLVRMSGRGSLETLRTGWFATAPRSYAVSRDRVLGGIGRWPAVAIDDLAAGRSGVSGEPDAVPLGDAAVDQAAGERVALRLVGVLVRARLARLWHHGWRHDDWTVGVLDRPVASLLEGADVADVDWAPSITGHYTADPFGRWEGDTLRVVYEDYAHARGRATIATRTWDRVQGWQAPAEALDIGSHLSYPFLLADGEERLMMPESQASGALRIYASPDGVSGWRPRHDVDLPMGVADATLLRHGDRWWLFACRADRLNPATELWLWHAQTLDGPWVAHVGSPVVVDVRAARPAGPLFEAQGRLFRPAQDCSTGYGDRLAIREVLELTPERYAERTVTIVRPDPQGPYPFGLHTLTGVGDVTLIDGKRRIRDWGGTVRAIRERLLPGR
jgi:hypothetical protein